MKNFSFLILFLISAAACKKNNDARPLLVLTFSKEALKYVQLPLNRYFIYKDSATGISDSVVATKSDLYMDPHPARSTGVSGSGYGSGSTFADLDSEQVYKLILTNPVTQVKWYDVEAHAGSGFSFYIIDTTSLTFCGRDNLIPVSIDRNNNCSYGFSYSSGISTVLASLVIDINTYNNVFEMVSTNGLEQDAKEPWYFKSIYYWAKNIGIIKRTVKTSNAITTCTLVRYGQ